jgi:hypothetical protein
MADVEFSENQVIVRIPKAVLVLTKQEFLRALQRGKAYRRREQQKRRILALGQEDR